jgi:hypothetical protein
VIERGPAPIIRPAVSFLADLAGTGPFTRGTRKHISVWEKPA